MAIGSGLASQFGFVGESTYGTAVTVTKFPRHKSGTHVRQRNIRVQGEGITSGLLGHHAGHYVETAKAAEVALVADVASKGLGLLLQALMGTTVTPVQQGGTPAYLQTHTLADPVGKFLTCQVGVPRRGGTVDAWTGKGCKMTSAEFTCEAKGILQAAWALDAREFDTAIALASASYVATNPFHFLQLTTKLGTFGAEASVSGVRSVSCKIDRPLDVEGYYAGAAGLKTEPVLEDRTMITGKLTVDHLNLTDFADRFHNNTSTSLVLEWIGPQISGAFFETFRVTVPGIYLIEDSPNADGTEVVKTDFNYEWKYDGTNMPKIEYISTDTTL